MSAMSQDHLQSQLSHDLVDPYGRQFKYLRLSVTEVCNFSCQYCLPQGYQKPSGGVSGPLDLNEIEVLIQAFKLLGVQKIRLTGGEPTVRSDIIQIIRLIKKIDPNIKVALSTNGFKLHKILPELIQSGLGALNISLDSLDPQRFKQLTQNDLAVQLKAQVERAIVLGVPSVKVNAVLLKQTALQELELFLKWTKSVPVTVRFIELMETGLSRQYYHDNHLSSSVIEQRLLELGWSLQPRQKTAGPAKEYAGPDHAGKIGVIAPYAKDFCLGCNRLRVTSRGALKLCLFGDQGYSLRNYLSSPKHVPALAQQIQSLLGGKAESHGLAKGDFGATQTLSAMGG